ncbi:SKP1-like protein 11 [Amaranthus tricolor]|uniref:SKP1-like protein 11 n=1 Tax=Amaranthus tricolor TaxID=29722 RepID=UPI00258CE995|nr:SKP1-like protein 11 [Amaranthus tricolor]
MTSSSSSMMIRLKSIEGEIFELEEMVALQMGRINTFLLNVVHEECCTRILFPVKLTSLILSKIICYCQKHARQPNNHQELKNWDKQFIEDNINFLIDIIHAVDYLQIKSFRDNFPFFF